MFLTFDSSWQENLIGPTSILVYCHLNFQEVLCTTTLLIKIIKEKCSETSQQPLGQQWLILPLILISLPIQLCLCCLCFERLFLDHVFRRVLFLHAPSLLARAHVCKGPPHTGLVFSLPHDLWPAIGFTSTAEKVASHVTCELHRTRNGASSGRGRYPLVIYLVGNAGSYTKLSSSWGYPMETNLSTVRSNPRDSYSGDLYTVPRWDFS